MLESENMTMKRFTHIISLYARQQRLAHLLLVPGIRVNYEPLTWHVVSIRASLAGLIVSSISLPQRPFEILKPLCHHPINAEQVESEEHDGDEDDDCSAPDLGPSGPGGLAHLEFHFLVKLADAAQQWNFRHFYGDTSAALVSTLRGGLGALRQRTVLIRKLCCSTHDSPDFLPQAYVAGVPGFEPGLTVLETAVLAADTIPLHTPQGSRSHPV